MMKVTLIKRIEEIVGYFTTSQKRLTKRKKITLHGCLTQSHKPHGLTKIKEKMAAHLSSHYHPLNHSQRKIEYATNLNPLCMQTYYTK